jgi:hypothetical protein|tara:strand:- start:673 stop:1122 length:450 start_codon:yes stop_codon:yes gene_type:complete
MARQRSEVSRFKSPSTGEYCTVAQYIAEILIQRKAEADNKGSLTYKFWNKTQRKNYTRQVQAVSTLIGKFGEPAVFDYIINTNRRVYSASPKWVKEAVEQHRLVLDRRPKQENKVTEVSRDNIESQPRKTFGKKTLFSKLRSTDGKSQK